MSRRVGQTRALNAAPPSMTWRTDRVAMRPQAATTTTIEFARLPSRPATPSYFPTLCHIIAIRRGTARGALS